MVYFRPRASSFGYRGRRPSENSILFSPKTRSLSPKRLWYGFIKNLLLFLLLLWLFLFWHHQGNMPNVNQKVQDNFKVEDIKP